jgi:hypothetical protein
MRHTLALVLSGCCLCAAEPQTVSITDWTGRGFAPDLVGYDIAAPADAGRLRVLDAAGASLPWQLTPGAAGRATLHFIGAVPLGGTASWTIRSDGQGATAKPAVSVSADGGNLVLANDQLAVRVPGVQEKTFAQPVAADTLPAPVLAFRGPDGAWRGAGSILSKRLVKKLSVAQTATGPVFVETRYRLDWAEGGFLEARVRVTERAPFAQVSEDYELGAAANAHYWQLDLSAGWKPDAAEHMAVAGQGFSPVVYPSLEAEEKATAAGPSVGADFPGGGSAPTRSIHHDSCWGARYVSYYGVHQAEARKASPEAYAMAFVAPLHKGAWRRANSLPVHVKGGQVTVRFPMDVAPISWLNEPASDVSPFSCHEHDPSLPAVHGRRVWALVLAKPAMLVDGYGGKKTLGIGYAVRNLYGTIGLDRYKDFVLAWPDAKPSYPRVFITPEGVAKYREAVKHDPAFPLLGMVRKYYWFTGDAATAQQELPEVHKRLQDNVAYAASALSIHHHHTLSAYGEPIGHAESVLSWPDLPAEDRARIRGRLALLCYLLTDPDVTSAGNGSHHGNPNMGVSRLSDRANLVALIPDHPMHQTWRDYVGSFTAYKMGSFMAPEGGWFEYGASYHMHGYGKILRGIMGAISSGAPQAAQMSAYHRTDLDYYLNLLSPVDPRYGSRTIPGTANSPVGNPPHLIQAMGSVADPVQAANLRWGWDASGRMIGTGGDAITMPAMIRPEIAAKEPQLTSRIYPGFGVIFRAHQGPDETCLYLRSGYLWSHWDTDQGNLMLYAKGAVLLPSQPYQYGGPKDKTFPDKNQLRFGDPANTGIHDWADSNILDASFGSSVDYAWSSTGFPDWYIEPGNRPGWGGPRPLAAGAVRTPGAFSWDRQIAFLKSAKATGANYFVIRDSMNGPGKLPSWFNLSLLGRKANVAVDGERVALDSEWPTKLELLFPGRGKPAFELAEDDLPLALGAYNLFTGKTEGATPSRDWVKDGKPLVLGKDVYKSGQGAKEQHVALRLHNAPGQEVAWVLYPRGAGEAAPTATPLAPGVTKVVTGEGTDYVFLSAVAFTWTGEGVTFAGQAGAVRVAKDGTATLVLSAGPGKVGWQEALIESAVPFHKTVKGKQSERIAAPAWKIQAGLPPISAEGNKIRFVVAERKYVELVQGNVGVRGVGPFDLTFTPDGITGQVDGDIRTIVTTWPEQITRPMYHMDGVLWYAGFADEHSFVKGTSTPQFGIAIGVSAGAHTVRIGEWQWPAMPPVPPRTVIP